MQRSGALLAFVVTIAGLAGCVSVPLPDGVVATPSDPPAIERSCPEGFFEALTEHLATQPVGDFTEVRLIEEPTFAFLPDPINDTVREGCVFRVERESAVGDIGRQVFGVTSGADQSKVIDILESAGWVQLFPDVEPSAWGNAELESVGIYTMSGSDFGLAFPGWSDVLLNYFDATETILQSVPAI